MPELIIPPGLVCGIDEAGRGPLAGPVVAAAVILDPARPIAGLERLQEALRKKTRAACRPDPRTGARLGGGRGVGRGNRPPQYPAGDHACHAAGGGRAGGSPGQRAGRRQSLPGAGDAGRSRDQGRRQDRFDRRRVDSCQDGARCRDAGPARFAIRNTVSTSHMGYPTAAHFKALEEHGASPVHRRSFGPVARQLALVMKLIRSRDNPFFKGLKRLAESGRERRKTRAHPARRRASGHGLRSGPWPGRDADRCRIGAGWRGNCCLR